jgi:hypothetical protein
VEREAAEQSTDHADDQVAHEAEPRAFMNCPASHPAHSPIKMNQTNSMSHLPPLLDRTLQYMRR